MACTIAVSASHICDSVAVQTYCDRYKLKVRLRMLPNGKLQSCLVTEGGKVVSPLFSQAHGLIGWVFRQSEVDGGLGEGFANRLHDLRVRL